MDVSLVAAANASPKWSFNASRGCLQGLRSGKVCCAASCGSCSAAFAHEAGCESRPGGAARCCSRDILEANRPCSHLADTGCVVAGVGAAVEHYCHWLQHHRHHQAEGAANGGERVCAEPSSTCLESSMRRHAKRHNVSLAMLKARTLQRCLQQPQGSRTRAVRDVLARGCSGGDRAVPAPWRGALPSPWHNQSGALNLTKQATPTVWLAAIVKDQNGMLQDWLLWHLVLGISKILLYDNNSQDQEGLRKTLRPFIEAGAVELVPWPAHGSQVYAYEDAVSRTWKRGVPFVAAIDVDERIVPHGFGCITDSAQLPAARRLAESTILASPRCL